MAEAGLLLAIIGLTIVVPAIDASSLSPWYCQRLVSPWITSVVTPCMFPCLFISPHEHHHIVMHSEVDGTSCKVPSGLHQDTKMGTCKRGVCTPTVGHRVLKRKKRFICLIALAKLLKAKREKRLLKEEIERLKHLTLLNSLRTASLAGGRGLGLQNLNTVARDGTRIPADNLGSRDVVEIHITPTQGGGPGVDMSARGSSRPFLLGNNARGGNDALDITSSVPGNPSLMNSFDRVINGGRTSFNHERTGGVGAADFTAAASDIARINAVANAGVRGSGGVTSGIGRGRNFALGIHSDGRSLEGNIREGDRFGGSGPPVTAGRVMNAGSISGIDRRAGGGTGSRATRVSTAAAAVVSVARTGRSGVGGEGGSGSLTGYGPRAVSGGVVGSSSAVSTTATANPSSTYIGVRSAGAAFTGSRSSSGTDTGGDSSFVGSISSGTAGRGSGIAESSVSSRGRDYLGSRRGTNNLLRLEEVGDRDIGFDDGDNGDDEEIEVRSGNRDGYRG
ncbi:uncharacterized protein LOC144165117 isoform X1 [Haemaphysalis longicornis]